MVGRIAQEREQVRPGLLQAGGHGRALQPPLAHECLPPGFDLLHRLGVDHVGVVGADLVVQFLRRMGKQVPMLMNRTTLDRYRRPQRCQRRLQAPAAVDDQQLRRGQLAADQIVQEGAPRRLALATHVAQAQKNLLPVPADAQRHQHRDPGRPLVQPDLDHRAVQNDANDVVVRQIALLPGFPVALHLAPGPAYRVLADRPAEQGSQGTAGVGSGQIGSGDQGLGPFGQPLVGRQRLVAPLSRRTVGPDQPGARHRHGGRTERAEDLSIAVTVPMPLDWSGALIPPAVQRRLQFTLQHRLDERADMLAYPGFQRIEPVLQGNRVKKSCGNKACKEIIVPAGDLAPKA